MSDDAEAHILRGNGLYRRGDVEGAIESYRAALALEPGNPRAHYNLGVILQHLNRPDEAIGHYARAVEAEPTSSKALVNWGLVLLACDKLDDAQQRLAQALSLDRGDSVAASNLAHLASKAYDQSRLDIAAASLEAILAAQPDNPQVHCSFGLVLQGLHRLDDAIAHYRRAIELRPDFVEALVNWGVAARSAGDLEGSLALFRRALAVDATNRDALNNLGTLLMQSGELEEAQDAFRGILRAHPDYKPARLNLGIVALHRQEFASAWDAYELRLEVLANELAMRATSLPRLPNVHAAKGKRVAVLKEQGLGDQILFSTLLPELGSAGIEAVVEVDDRLLDAYRRSVPDIDFVSSAAMSDALAGCDYHIPLGSLGSLFRRSVRGFSGQTRALLRPDERRVRAMRKALPAGATAAISWRSFQDAARGDVERRKSIPLECFAGLAASGVALVDLQYGDADAERNEFDARHPGLRVDIAGLDRLNDLEGLLAAMEACDIVITSSNVTAHLAGAIGKRTWLVYLGAVAPFHYWVPGPGGRCLWYPSIEIMTDPAWTAWRAAFDALAARFSA